MGKKCQEKTKTGKACRAYAVSDSDFCWSHEPGLKHQRKKAKKRGGHLRHLPNGKNPCLIQGVDDVLQQINSTLDLAWGLPDSVSKGRLINALCNTALGVVRPPELEERVNKLERQYGLKKAEDHPDE